MSQAAAEVPLRCDACGRALATADAICDCALLREQEQAAQQQQQVAELEDQKAGGRFICPACQQHFDAKGLRPVVLAPGQRQSIYAVALERACPHCGATLTPRHARGTWWRIGAGIALVFGILPGLFVPDLLLRRSLGIAAIIGMFVAFAVSLWQSRNDPHAYRRANR